ncbi:MAG: YezD family protein [Pirellulales bacterium]
MSQPNEPQHDASHEAELQQIREALRGLRYGSVNIIVQDGLIVQIDRTEKRRLRGAREERVESRK